MREIKIKFPLILFFCLVGWYALLSFTHYMNQRALWNDEQCVLNSIQQFSNHDIFNRQLLNVQVFPRGYLFLIKNVAQICDDSRLGLRLLPFISMMAAFILWLKIARSQAATFGVYLTFVLSWSASITLIYYAAELKQYSMDVLTAAIFLLFLYHQPQWQRRPGAGYGLLLLILPFLGLLSYPAFLFLIFPFWNLWTGVKENRQLKRYLIFYTLAAITAVGLSFWFDMRWRPLAAVKGHSDYFVSFASVGDFFKTFGEGVNNLFSRWFVEKPKILRCIARFFVAFGLVNMVVGFIRQRRESPFYFDSIGKVALIVFFELFLLGALKKYPFTVPRTSLFFCPIILFLTADMISRLKTTNKYIYFLIQGGYVLFLCVVSLGLAREVLGGDLGAQSPIWIF